jgi:hypothetical protein
MVALSHDGYEYYKKDELVGSIRYRCIKSKIKNIKCKATITKNKKTGAITKSKFKHCCKPSTLAVQLDLCDEAVRISKEKTLDEPTKPATVIYTEVMSKLKEIYKDRVDDFIIPTKKKLISTINNAKKSISETIDDYIHSNKFSNISSTDSRKFLRFDFTYATQNTHLLEKNKLHRILLWSHPDLFPMLKRAAIRMHIDGTFRCVPRPFTQCVIVLMHDDETELNVPVVYGLVDSKETWTYWHLFHLCSVLADCRMDPKYITSDFEGSIIQATKEYFPKAIHIGCDFHMKRAIKKKLERLSMPRKEVTKFMKYKLVDKLRNIGKNEIASELERQRRNMHEDQNHKKIWKKFYTYFNRVWIEKNFNLWNNSDRVEDNMDEIPKTNNCLENFNRILNNEFPRRHPNIYEFIEKIRKISNETVFNITNKRRQGI